MPRPKPKPRPQPKPRRSPNKKKRRSRSFEQAGPPDSWMTGEDADALKSRRITLTLVGTRRLTRHTPNDLVSEVTFSLYDFLFGNSFYLNPSGMKFAIEMFDFLEEKVGLERDGCNLSDIYDRGTFQHHRSIIENWATGYKVLQPGRRVIIKPRSELAISLSKVGATTEAVAATNHPDSSDTKVILRAGGERKSVSLEEAKAIRERFQSLAEGNEVEGIDLSCRQWMKESLEELEDFLKGVAGTVRYLIVDDIIAGLMTDEGLAVTQKLADIFLSSDLLEVNLNDNAMGERGLGRVQSLFLNSNLKRLYLSNCGLSHYSMVQLQEYLMADDQRVAKSLRELVLDKNMIGPEGAEVVGSFLPHCVNLELFSYKGSRARKAGSKHLAQGLLGLVNKAGKPLIKHLDFNDCHFGDGEDEDEGGLVPLTAAIAKCKQLRYLDLKDNELKAAGLSRLVHAMEESKVQLIDLLLDGNELEEEGAELLASWLESQATSLKRLHLSLNELGNEGVATVMVPFLASRNVLEYLYLEENMIDNDGAKAVLMARLPELKHLSLRENEDIEEEMKVQLLSKFGKDVVVFGDVEEDMDDLVAKMSALQI